MQNDLLDIATRYPDLTISVKLSDLLEVGRTIKEELLQELSLNQPETHKADEDELRSREEAMQILKVSSATLWRWKKCGYLVPVKVGSMDRYRLSDIKALLEQKGGEL